MLTWPRGPAHLPCAEAPGKKCVWITGIEKKPGVTVCCRELFWMALGCSMLARDAIPAGQEPCIVPIDALAVAARCESGARRRALAGPRHAAPAIPLLAHGRRGCARSAVGTRRWLHRGLASILPSCPQAPCPRLNWALLSSLRTA